MWVIELKVTFTVFLKAFWHGLFKFDTDILEIWSLPFGPFSRDACWFLIPVLTIPEHTQLPESVSGGFRYTMDHLDDFATQALKRHGSKLPSRPWQLVVQRSTPRLFHMPAKSEQQRTNVFLESSFPTSGCTEWKVGRGKAGGDPAWSLSRETTVWRVAKGLTAPLGPLREVSGTEMQDRKMGLICRIRHG